MRFYVTYDLVPKRSAIAGDTADDGWLDESGKRCPEMPSPMSLREALEVWDGESYHVEADCYPFSIDSPPRWLIAYRETDTDPECLSETRSLHFPDELSAASCLRIARLVDCYEIEVSDPYPPGVDQILVKP